LFDIVPLSNQRTGQKKSAPLRLSWNAALLTSRSQENFVIGSESDSDRWADSEIVTEDALSG
jgi:hypothetical protein